MEIAYYDLSGGINQALTKTELGLNTKKIFWTDSKNVEILQNRGICKQKGNKLFINLPLQDEISGLFEMFSNNQYKLLITTISGKIYIYDDTENDIKLIEKTISGQKPLFANYLNGTIIATESDSPFYINFSDNIVSSCNLTDFNSKPIIVSSVTVYKGRVWFCSGSTIYYSALGRYDDFSTEKDAGYISDFHTDTANIVVIKPYKDYLAIYKKDSVYLLTGSNPENFAIIPFANKGCASSKAIVNVENKQYFLSNGIYALEQVGELNQIQLGSEISTKIKPELEKLSKTNLQNSFCIHYENRNQIWYFFPYESEKYYHTIWINDYVNKAWYKRVIPQNITTACIFKGKILSADNNGNIYTEDTGKTFNGKAINFLWKSPFLALNNAHHRKIIEEFYFILDESYDNKFKFSVYKDYNSQRGDDPELIYAVNLEHLIWADDETSNNLPCHWAKDDENFPVWSINQNTLEKAEISEANYSIQLCIEGIEEDESCGIIGLQFREIYNDD